MAILVVKKNIMHRYQSVGQAIQDAEAGDFIEIRDGVYEENIDVPKRLTIYGVGDVTIKGGVFIRYHTHVAMRNLRFSQGQGIYIKGDLQLENCIIEQQMIRTQVTVNYGSLMLKNVDIIASPLNQYGLRIDNGSSVMLTDSTIQHHTKAQIIAQNSELVLTNCLLLEGQMNAIFAISNVKMDIVNCEMHGHQKTQMVAASSTISMKDTLIHQGQDLGIQIVDHSQMIMEFCEVKQHIGTNIVVHESELKVSHSIFAEGQGNGIYVGEHSKAVIYDCQLSEHNKPQLFIENSKAEIHKCSIRNGVTSGVTIINEADVMMTACKIQQHPQFHFIVDASGLQLNESIIESGQAGGIYGNEHAKITLKHTTIREVDSHHLYINNARLFVENSTFAHIIGNGITCIDAIFEIISSDFIYARQSPYAIVWSDKSMGRIEQCFVEDTERIFLAMTNQSLLEIVNTNLANVKTAAIVQDQSQLYVRGYANTAKWHGDTSSKIVDRDVKLTTSNEKIQHIVSMLSSSKSIQELNKELQIPAEVLQEIYTTLKSTDVKKTI
ncbi:right-handed parallel beta-helix repeat-containing protein [Lysinibacillus sphaericus]|uniref:Right handed beta helix domain-containing protein n=1 Tax=Lysinibacillus sphaericus OT4b.31 TaxID=1285586 RepID=R7ZCN9_LYSSH|nr:right-handed parallel beta-helix repeat-containing protein [Lysinibacillus sphaericus]EON71910.1 hypothetical protein H131_13238 [Lysinibacillus sphaericus OT4b.31]